MEQKAEPKEKDILNLAPGEMSRPEIDQFLTCARVGRIGLALQDGPYIVPVGYGYSEGEIYFHTCREGIKIEALRSRPTVCFEVDESISDVSLAKSVIILGKAELIQEDARKIPYLEKLIDKYRVPATFGQYMARRPDRNVKEELQAVMIGLITPFRITGRKFVRTTASFGH
jgi:hypothetical protein